MKKFISGIMFLLFNQLVVGQQNNITTHQIDSILIVIERTCVRAGISDGIITSQETGQTIGGFSDWYFADSAARHLLKVVHEQGAGTYDFDHYYFNNDQLICIIFSRGKIENEERKVTSTGKYYFNGKKLIGKQDEIEYSFDKDFYLKTAKQYLKESNLWSH